MEQLLIVDDSEDIRKQLKWGLAKEYDVHLAADGREAIELFKKIKPKVVTLDLGLPPDADGSEEGFRCLREIMGLTPATKVIVVTGNEGREAALRAIESGAYDYYQKPIDLHELRVIVRRAFHLSNIEDENRRLNSQLDGKLPEFGGIVGQCPEMLDVFSTIRKVATSDVSVLITGESGTGKELVAKAIHMQSLRKSGPFVPINCGAIPENLLESELFGHEKGAFTGAHSLVQGKVEYANKGTLFLDEIGELPVNLQVKILRFLQDKILQRVGGREDVQVDARIVAATNVDIEKAISEGLFREDLYYRLGVITIRLIPLRERGTDRLLLANLFLNRFRTEFKKKVRGFAPAALDLIDSYNWPGNVRELENKIQRAVIMSESAMVEPRDLGFGESAPLRQVQQRDGISLKEAKEMMEREMISAAIEQHRGNIAKASEELGISRPTLYDLMKKHSIHSSH
jgi:two-component system NtrC family response regulator